jgi:hypothetical protein
VGCPTVKIDLRVRSAQHDEAVDVEPAEVDALLVLPITLLWLYSDFR